MSTGSTPSPQESSSQESLQAGLVALNQQHYEAAIAHLATVCHSATDAALIEQAQAGLVNAYTQTEQPNLAIGLCQALQTSRDSQVRSWASQTLRELVRRYPVLAKPLEAPDETGFVAFADPAAFNQSAAQSLNQPASAREIISQDGSITRAALPPEAPVANPKVPDSNFPSTAHLSATEPLEAESFEPESFELEALDREPELGADDPPTAIFSKIDRSKPTPAKTSPAAPAPIAWKNAGRASKWNTLGTLDRSPLWALTAGTAIAFIWLLKTLPMLLQDCLRWFFWQLALLTPFKRLMMLVSSPQDPWLNVAIALLLLFAVSPWLMDVVLRQFYGMKPIKLLSLEPHSPETVRLVKRVTHQRRLPLPTLELLPTTVPLAFTYGYLPQNARIVVTQGALDQLEDAELATLFAAELGHIIHWNFGVLSWVTLVAQLPYLVYWNLAAWGDRQHDRVLQTVAILGSSVGYGLYWICRLPGLWLSRQRLYYSDRTAAELTGNPNALTRMLLKLAIGTAQETERWGHSSYLLESFDLLTPIGYRTALSAGSTYSRSPQAAILEWDRRNPYRHWLAALDAQPPLGDRLHLLMLYAQHWRLEGELDWQNQSGTAADPPTPLLRRKFRLQVAPFLGALIGFSAAMALWVLGWVADKLDWLELTWLLGDRSVLVGLALIGFGIGSVIRINAFFPDIDRASLLIDPDLAELLAIPTGLAIDSQPVRFQGKLLGRRGFANWGHQDLVLQTATGLVRLHHTTRWGLLGNLLPQPLRPPSFMPHPVTVTGWFRRGATPWIDVDTVQGKVGRLQGQHPLWSTLLAFATALLGIFVIFRGGA
jgi:Zn-dependent protease with chaperone function